MHHLHVFYCDLQRFAELMSLPIAQTMTQCMFLLTRCFHKEEQYFIKILRRDKY